MDTQAAHMQLRKKTETEIGFPLLFLLRDKVQKSLKVEFILELIAGLSEWHFGSKLLKIRKRSFFLKKVEKAEILIQNDEKVGKDHFCSKMSNKLCFGSK